MSIVKENSFRVAALEINEDGKVSRKNMTVIATANWRTRS
jgi:hypothetical protein